MEVAKHYPHRETTKIVGRIFIYGLRKQINPNWVLPEQFQQLFVKIFTAMVESEQRKIWTHKMFNKKLILEKTSKTRVPRSDGKDGD
jgi:hypothetical protein